MKGFRSLIEMFHWRVEQSRLRPALWFKREGRYRSMNWGEFAREVRETALGLYSLGVRKGDRVGILSENRPEWAFADLAVLSLGAASVPVYPTSSVKECRYILEHAEISLLFVSNSEQAGKIKPLRDEGKLKKAIVFDERGMDFGPPSSGVIRFTECLEKGRLSHLNQGDFYDGLSRGTGREDLATLIYTSGTTGPPKGVMLTHGNFLSNCEAAAEALPLGEDEQSLSFLPLSHVFERMAGYYFMIQEGVSIAYAQSLQSVPEDLLLVRPTVAAGVPRFFEKMHARILENVKSSSPVKQKLFDWALKVGEEAGILRQIRKPLPFFLRIRFAFARILVFNKLKKKLGGRIRFFISGGAPLAKELARFFYAADVLILEGYGLTETSPVISVNRPERFKFGTVGPLLPGVELRIAEDREILTRGPHVMKGYFKNDEATREAVREGWFYTGDLGEIDPEGFLKITGRKKDLIITAGGKNISPQNIENEILGDPFFSQAVVLGDRRPYLVALVVPNRPELENWGKGQGLETPSWEALLRNETVIQMLQERLQERMKDFAPYEQIKYFHLLPKELSQDAGELTPTLKIKRRVMMERYAQTIEALYRKGESQKLLPHGH